MNKETNAVIARLDELAKELEHIRMLSNDELNVFNEVGLGHQEVRHSTFIARLLDPTKPHGLGNLALKKLFEKLPTYDKTNGKTLPTNFNSNETIFNNAISQVGISAFLASDDITVDTEQIGKENNRRIDILIQSPKEKTDVVIENKTFSTTHDDQLQKYEDKFVNAVGWKKIYIYLTIGGELPQDDNGVYKENWCRFDYEEIYKIVKEILGELKSRNCMIPVRGKQKNKLKVLLEDYMETVDAYILKGNMKLMRKCKEIYTKYEKELEILINYHDNTLEALELCRGWLLGKGVKLHKSNKPMAARILAYTESMEDFFKKNSETLTKTECYLLAQVNEPNLEIYIELEKGNKPDWSPAQLKILEHYDSNGAWKKSGYYKLKTCSVTLLNLEERGEALEDSDGNDRDVKTNLKNRLNNFVDTVLFNFENILKKL